MNIRCRAALGAAALFFLSTAVGKAAEGIRWQTSLEAAKAEAKKSHKLIMADFYAEW